MKLIEGNSATVRRKFSYRGHFIWGVARSGDARRKTSKGYEWHVEFADGTLKNSISGTRSAAKEIIDSVVGGAK